MTLNFINGRLFLLLLLFSGTLLISCDKSDLEHENRFDASYQSWLDFKEASRDSYHYQVPGSTWTGASWETTITVTDGVVTQRHFKFTSMDGLIIVPHGALEWTENEGEINSLLNTGAAEALTLDQIYDKARSELLVKRENAKTYFEANNNGLISSCGYVEEGCQDDCFVGINIAFVEEL